jgi:peptidoglycan hydrolase-like protein with peptidoglycan-binding domain
MITTTTARRFGAIGLVSAFVVMALIATLTLSTAHASIDTSLDIGSTGTEVTELQAYLSLDRSIYPEGLVTGYYGPLTRAAVMRFQALHGIPQVGRVGPMTLASLNSLMGGAAIGGSTDRSAPLVTSGVRESVDNRDDSATLSWTTNEVAQAWVHYGTDRITVRETMTPFTQPAVSGADEVEFEASYSSSKSIELEDLERDETYYYAIIVADTSGNVTIVREGSFETN